MLTIFGISNCDKCRATRKWFADRGSAHQFHDLRKDGLTSALVSDWLERLDVDTLINKRGKTWREIPQATREKLTPNVASELILNNPTLTKRPLIDTGSELLVGYDEELWNNLKL